MASADGLDVDSRCRDDGLDDYCCCRWAWLLQMGWMLVACAEMGLINLAAADRPDGCCCMQMDLMVAVQIMGWMLIAAAEISGMMIVAGDSR